MCVFVCVCVGGRGNVSVWSQSSFVLIINKNTIWTCDHGQKHNFMGGRLRLSSCSPAEADACLYEIEGHSVSALQLQLEPHTSTIRFECLGLRFNKDLLNLNPLSKPLIKTKSF